MERFGDGQELSRQRIAAFAATPGDPAAVAIQISHRHHCVANGYAAHGAAFGHDHARQVEAKDDRGRPPKEVKLGELVLQRVERRGGDADQNLVGPRPRDRNTHRLQWKPGPVFGVADAEERLWGPKCLLHDNLLHFLNPFMLLLIIFSEARPENHALSVFALLLCS
jgi:hypothetical protein